MKRFLLIALVFTNIFLLSAQSGPSYQSNSSLNFSSFISGVKYVEIEFSDRAIRYVENYKNNGLERIIYGFFDYIESLGLTILGSHTTYGISSLCDKTKVVIDFDFQLDIQLIKDISCTFISCNGDRFVFNFGDQWNTLDIRNKIVELFNNR